MADRSIEFKDDMYNLIEKSDKFTNRQILSSTVEDGKMIKTFTSTNLTLNTIANDLTDEIVKNIAKQEVNIYQYNGTLEASTPPTSDRRALDPVSGDFASNSEGTINVTGFNSNRGFTKAKYFRGSLRLGKCEVLNPPHQFHSNDDVRSNPYYPFYGRIYNEAIRNNFPIVVIEPGRIKFNTNPTALGMMMAGSGGDVKRYIKGNRGVIGKIISGLGSVKRIGMRALTGFGRIYKFRPDMHLFIKYFNQMAHEVADYLGLIKVGFFGDDRNAVASEQFLRGTLKEDDDGFIKIGNNKFKRASVYNEKAAREKETNNFGTKAAEVFGEAFEGVQDFFQEAADSLTKSGDMDTELDESEREIEDAKFFEEVDDSNLYEGSLYPETNTKNDNEVYNPYAVEEPKKPSKNSLDHTELVNVVVYKEDTDKRITLSPDDVGAEGNRLVPDKERDEQTIGNYIGSTDFVRMSEFLPTYDILYDSAGESPDEKDSRKHIKRNFGIALGKYNYIQFLLQSNASLSESISNSTTNHPLENTINSKADDAYSRKMGMHIDPSAFGDDLSSMGHAVTKTVTTYTQSTIKAATMGDIGSMMAGEGGRVALPEIYQSSSFNRSVNLSFEFWSPRGDVLSCFENTILQLLVWVILATPVKAGKFSYMAPFNMRINAMGLFNMNLATIDSINIQRGESKNDRTEAGIFRTIKVNVSVKDLLPAALLSMDSGLFSIFHRHNDAMRQYLMLLGNVPLAKQRNILDNLAKSSRRFANATRNKFSGANIAAKFSESLVGRGFRTYVPVNEYVGSVDKGNADLFKTSK